MSIRDEINRHLASSELVRRVPNLSSIPRKREVILSRELSDLVGGPWPTKEATEAFSRLQYDLDGFIGGDIATVARKPQKAKTAFLNRLANERGKTWELRQRFPKPGIRVLGGFSEKDVFVGLTWWPRIMLEGYGSREWRDAIQECKNLWQRLFLTWPPIGEPTWPYDDYVSSILLI